MAGTGHRSYGYKDHSFNVLIDLNKAVLEKYKPDLVISGMALGFDLTLAKASHNMKIPFVAAVPFSGQADKWESKWKNIYDDLMFFAEDKIIISPCYNKGVFQKRNDWMVDQLEGPGDFLLALWDGSDGGTKNCVRYAEKKNKKIVNIWQTYQALI